MQSAMNKENGEREEKEQILRALRASLGWLGGFFPRTMMVLVDNLVGSGGLFWRKPVVEKIRYSC